MVKYRIQQNADAPVRRRGRRLKWDIPVEELEPGAVLLLPMSELQVHTQIVAVRSFISREQQRLGRKFSVYKTDEGIAIFRREDGIYDDD